MPTQPQPSVILTRRGQIAVVTIDNPPVNALSLGLREKLAQTLSDCIKDLAVKGIVLACEGRTFVAGSDVSEFGTPRQTQQPRLPDICEMLDKSEKPTLAAVHGSVLGGGLELAMACHFRIAAPDTRLGLPEVTLGLIPGAGGTVRLPRLVGPSLALSMIVLGSRISAEEAQRSGLVDGLTTGNLLADAVHFLSEMLRQAAIPVSRRDEKIDLGPADQLAIEELSASLLSKNRGLTAPAEAAAAVRNAILLPFDEALKREREVFLRLSASAELKALRHLFFAEKEAFKVPGAAGAQPRSISRIGVVGAGTMGGGIAMSFANAGLPIRILETTEEALSRGMGNIARNYDGSVKRGSISQEERDRRFALIAGTTSADDLSDCDLVIEAVYEDMEVKKALMQRLDSIAKPGAIIATNTSYLDVNEIARSTSRPQDVVGLHFFSPANVMKLLEIVRGEQTSTDVIATSLELARKIGKVPVVVGVCHGFVGNRMLAARNSEAENLLLEGASPQDIDAAFRAFGWPMGPFEMWDLAGLDISWRNRKALGKSAAIADELCERGWFGQKAGVGFYRYPDGSRTPQPNPDVTSIIETESRRQAITRRKISEQEILERTLYPMINEGQKILQEKISSRSSDIDVVWVNGYGFPKAKGGPLHWAETAAGLDEIRSALAKWYAQTGRPVFQPWPQ